MKSYQFVLVLALCTSLLSATFSQAGPISIQSNPVANGAITVMGGDNDRSDWNTIPSYPSDPNDTTGPIDFTSLQIAHDDDNIYMHLLFADSGFLGFQHNFFIDTDLDRGTGFIGGGGFLSTGSDFLIQGTSYFSFNPVGGQESFLWNFLGGIVWDDFPTTDIEIKIPRAALGNPDAFDIVLNAASAPEDYYPNGATAGAGGDFFRYVIVPEPSSAAATMCACLLLCAWCRRKARS